ncbi:uncharacterized protein LAJ45_08458 [Morchella importuna]|uniref:uncharacterized protein n=1 Tax=Morchella importuna TaxID=1174673 RepID=UPI001E8D1153|nr:uncharacterized protein LAJ45_08458 [Morchella importuna]KAH8147630.1 hypothetical protein LAJ45_08458 [Morchella importuna]
MTAQKALNTIYRDRDFPPWPIEGEFSIYPRESICRIIINKKGRICGKRISDSCAGSLRQHVKTAHLSENLEIRQRHLRKLELVPGKLGPPGREVVAEVVKELIRRYKNPFDLAKIRFDEDSSSDDEHHEIAGEVVEDVEEDEREEDEQEEDGEEEEEEEEATQVEEVTDVTAGGEMTDGEGDTPSEAGTCELASMSKHIPEYDGEELESQEKGSDTTCSSFDAGFLPEDGHEEVKLTREEKGDDSEEENILDNEKKSEVVAKGLQEAIDASSDWGYNGDDDGDDDEQVFEEDLEVWREERTWEKGNKQRDELMLDIDTGRKEHESHLKLKSEKKEDTPSKRQRSAFDDYTDGDENEDDHESWFSTPTPAPSKRQRTIGARYVRIERQGRPVALAKEGAVLKAGELVEKEEEAVKKEEKAVKKEEEVVKKEESPETPEVYYLARESGVFLDYEGDIYMSGI